MQRGGAAAAAPLSPIAARRIQARPSCSARRFPCRGLATGPLRAVFARPRGALASDAARDWRVHPQAEMHEWLTCPPDNWRLTSPAGGDDGALLRCWELLLEGSGLYENEVFTLRVRARGAALRRLRGSMR